MKKKVKILVKLLLGFMVVISSISSAQSEVRVGGGVHYWSAFVPNEDDDVDTDGFSLVSSAQ